MIVCAFYKNRSPSALPSTTLSNYVSCFCTYNESRYGETMYHKLLLSEFSFWINLKSLLFNAQNKMKYLKIKYQYMETISMWIEIITVFWQWIRIIETFSYFMRSHALECRCMKFKVHESLLNVNSFAPPSFMKLFHFIAFQEILFLWWKNISFYFQIDSPHQNRN